MASKKPIFEGKYLRFEKNGVMYKQGKKTSLRSALRKSGSGKKFDSLKTALDHSRKQLEEMK